MIILNPCGCKVLVVIHTCNQATYRYTQAVINDKAGGWGLFYCISQAPRELGMT